MSSLGGRGSCMMTFVVSCAVQCFDYCLQRQLKRAQGVGADAIRLWARAVSKPPWTLLSFLVSSPSVACARASEADTAGLAAGTRGLAVLNDSGASTRCSEYGDTGGALAVSPLPPRRCGSGVSASSGCNG
jgi:hypothetical protein